MQEDSMDKISVIIRNRNEEQYIGFALQSCIEQFNHPEIIIVDNNSTDNSLEVVNLFKDRANIKVISINDYTPGKSINLGANTASNELILVLSAHAQITNLNKKYIVENFKNNQYVAIFGQQNPIYKGKKITKRYIWSHFSDNESINLFSEIEKRYFLHNAFCFYKKSTLIEYPMPEKYAGKEDRYWASNMVKKGFKYLYSDSQKCNHFYTEGGATWKGIG
jgi:glycosyltransferase involved in cell wall biosynthesis